MNEKAIKSLLIISVPFSALLGGIFFNTEHYEVALFMITLCGCAYILSFCEKGR